MSAYDESTALSNRGSWTMVSPDGGKTCNKPVRCPVSAPHGPTVLRDGTLLYLGKQFHDEMDRPFGNVACAVSADGSEWREIGMDGIASVPPVSVATLYVATVGKMLAIPGFITKYPNPNYFLMSQYKQPTARDRLRFPSSRRRRHYDYSIFSGVISRQADDEAGTFACASVSLTGYVTESYAWTTPQLRIG